MYRTVSSKGRGAIDPIRITLSFFALAVRKEQVCLKGAALKMCDYFAEGQRLFNAGEFWHAHEQWEYCWRAAQPPVDMFYQGLIQAAAALVHLQRGNLRGLHLNWYKARPRLLGSVALLQSSSLQIKLTQFIHQIDRIVYDNGQYKVLPTLSMYPLAFIF